MWAVECHQPHTHYYIFVISDQQILEISEMLLKPVKSFNWD